MAFNGRIKPNDPDLKFDFDTVDGRTVSGWVVEFTQQRVDLGMRAIRDMRAGDAATLWHQVGEVWTILDDADVAAADDVSAVTTKAMSTEQFTQWAAQQQTEMSAILSEICGGSPAEADIAAMYAYQFGEFTTWLFGLISGDKRSKPVPAA